MEDKKIRVEAVIAKPIQKVWECWTQPKHIIFWNFASDDWQCPRAENDLKVGGKYSARMEAKDGSFGFDFNAIYNEVKEMKKLTYTMEDGRQSITDFSCQGDFTKVQTKFDPEQENSIEKQKNGWQSILNNFKKYTESI